MTEDLREAEEELVVLESLPDAEWERRAAEAYESSVADRERLREKLSALKAKYEDMLVKARRWKPPTRRHPSLKKFMIQQLKESIRFDCPSLESDSPERLTGSAWKKMELGDARRRVKRAEEKIVEERDRAEQVTAWVRALKESLGVAVGAQRGWIRK